MSGTMGEQREGLLNANGMDTEMPGLHSSGSRQRVVINIGGQRFVTYDSTLNILPGSRLARLSHSDPEYEPENQEYFFDRNARLFPYVLDGLRLGAIHFPHCMCAPSVKEELNFWGVPEELIATCCWRAYKEYEEQQGALARLDSAALRTELLMKRRRQTNISRWEKWKTNVLLFLEEPSSSLPAKVWSVLYVFALVLSLFLLVLGTEKACRINVVRDRPAPASLANTTNPKALMYWSTVGHPFIEVTSKVLIYLFLVELLLRFVVWPAKHTFWFDFFNVIDSVSILPLALVETVEWLNPYFFMERDLLVVHITVAIANVFRTFRILKIMNHNKGLRVLMLAMYASMREMMLLLLLVAIGMLIFSTTIYYAEFSRPDTFQSIPQGFWWSIITMTTVGFGDVYPKSPWGHVVGGMCAVAGMLITGLPIPIIANNFNLYYTYAKVSRHYHERKLKVTSQLRHKLLARKHRLLRSCRVGASDADDDEDEEV